MSVKPSELGRGLIMAAIEETWGVPVKCMAKNMGVNPKSLYSYLCSMERDGLVYRWTRGMWALTKKGEEALEDLRRRRK